MYGECAGRKMLRNKDIGGGTAVWGVKARKVREEAREGYKGC